MELLELSYPHQMFRPGDHVVITNKKLKYCGNKHCGKVGIVMRIVEEKYVYVKLNSEDNLFWFYPSELSKRRYS